MPIAVAAPSKTRFCVFESRLGHGSVYFVSVVCVVRLRFLRRAGHSTGGVLPSVVCLSVISKPQQSGGLGLGRAVKPQKKKKISETFRIHRRWEDNTVMN
jgi:hypothetical protein